MAWDKKRTSWAYQRGCRNPEAPSLLLLQVLLDDGGRRRRGYGLARCETLPFLGIILPLHPLTDKSSKLKSSWSGVHGMLARWKVRGKVDSKGKC